MPEWVDWLQTFGIGGLVLGLVRAAMRFATLEEKVGIGEMYRSKFVEKDSFDAFKGEVFRRLDRIERKIDQRNGLQ